MRLVCGEHKFIPVEVPYPVLTLNYLLEWGRLCIPNSDDSNNRRWQESELWHQIRNLVNEWSDGVYWPTSRLGKSFHEVTEHYAKYVGGTITGAMARFNENDPNMVSLLTGLEDFGITFKVLNTWAKSKAEIIKRL